LKRARGIAPHTTLIAAAAAVHDSRLACDALLGRRSLLAVPWCFNCLVTVSSNSPKVRSQLKWTSIGPKKVLPQQQMQGWLSVTEPAGELCIL